MKKTHKTIVGSFGLAAVVGMTFCAAFMPSPANAVSTVTDQLTVTVRSETPHIDPESGGMDDEVATRPEQTFTIPYSEINNLGLDVTYEDEDGNSYTFNAITDLPTNFAEGELNLTINFETGEFSYTYDYLDAAGNPQQGTGAGRLDHYGYGEYTFNFSGEGPYGDPVEGSGSVGFQAVDTDVTTNDETGEVTIDLDYNGDSSGTQGNNPVDEIVIEIFDENGNPVTPLSPIRIAAPVDQITFNPEEYGMEAGTYTIKVTAYDAAGNQMGKTYEKTFYYPGKQGGGGSGGGESDDSDKKRKVPNTGGLFGGTNISQTDFLVTGLIVFFIVGVGGIAFIARKGKKTSKRRK